MTDGAPTRRNWVRLDNASNIFLAARSTTDPKVFRMSVEVDHEVDPMLLQAALDETYDRFPLFHAVLRRGIFWYYLQDSDLRPTVAEDDQYTCFPIYQTDRRNLLFRILYYRRRIILEIFHALSDGTGALWFVSDLVTAYLRLKYPDEAPSEVSNADAPLTEPEESLAQTRGLVPDSFSHHFRQHRKQDHPTADFDHVAAAATAETEAVSEAAKAPVGSDSRLRALLRRPEQKVYRVRGARTPDNRARAVELTVNAKAALGLARAEGVSLTTYLTALFFESIRRSAGDLGDAPTMSASIPVNLRQFFPSTSARNFFATVHVEHTYGEGSDDLGSIARNLEEDFRPKATPEALEQKLRQLIRLERHQVIRIIPRPFKDVILRLLNWGNNRGLTVAISNLGRVSLPEPADSHVDRMYFHVSAVRPQFCAMSHGNQLTISFTSPFVETGHIQEFARHLTEHGVEVCVAAAAVTEEEIAELSS
ncbi:condensation domain-containing protein [Gulosibacter chungangensis]|uniref:Alcohol acetyltransferase n=1 Tax=Gulosibacter chungangensis TaxID=979746 RepID=A0A7J5BF85_9MICO|nr:alcohol acetyltransferase [Gulosibacter chungangensis]KAB1644923.1 alcohol acetyltransferase [Gulosibacter chungangensis]